MPSCHSASVGGHRARGGGLNGPVARRRGDRRPAGPALACACSVAGNGRAAGARGRGGREGRQPAASFLDRRGGGRFHQGKKKPPFRLAERRHGRRRAGLLRQAGTPWAGSDTLGAGVSCNSGPATMAVGSLRSTSSENRPRFLVSWLLWQKDLVRPDNQSHSPSSVKWPA